MHKEDFYREHDELVLSALQQSVIAIAGAGGLGSNCAVALSRCGTGKLIICDYDRVSASNLNRQYYFRDQIGLYKVQALKKTLKMINPFSEYIVYKEKLIPELIEEYFEDADVIIEAFDDAAQKEMLIETWAETFSDIPLIAASGIGGFGRNLELKQQKFGNLYLIGDEYSDVNQGFKPMSARVAVAANMQANLAVELLVKKFYGKRRKKI